MATAYLRPSQDIELNHTVTSGSTGYNMINEVTPDEDTTTIYATDASSAALETKSTFRFTGSISSSHRITAAKVVMRARQNDVSSTKTAEVLIYINGTEYTRQDVTTSYANYEWSIDTSLISVSGTSCTIDIVLADNLRNDKNTPYIYITQAYVELTTASTTSYTITTQALGTGTITAPSSVYQGESAVAQMVPGSGISITSLTDNGTNVTGSIVYVDPTPTTSVTGQVSGASYAFVNNGTYWISNNNGQSNSAAVCQLTLTCEAAATLVLAVVNYAEATYDYGIIGAVDQTLSTSYDKDSGTAWDGSDSSKNVSTEQDVTISIPAGTHFIQLKYRKDSGTSSNNDDFRWRIKSLTYNTTVTGYYKYTITNAQANHTLIVTYSDYGGSSFIWMKIDGTWKNCKSLWIKQNGTWVKQTTPPTALANKGIMRKHNPWFFDLSFRQAQIVTDTTWLISDYIAVTPDVELIVTGQGGDTNNTMWQAYKADKSYYDYWGGSGTTIATVGGRPVYQRTLSAANMANTYWVRVGAFKEAWSYIKVVQNGVTLFDGSQYPYN